MRVVILLFDNVDLLDVGGPYEVFLTASRLCERDGDAAPFTVATVSATDQPVVAYGGLTLGPSMRLGDVSAPSVVVVPGAVAIGAVSKEPSVRAAVDTLAGQAAVTSSVCTGAFLLAEAGLLDGRPFTTHWEDVTGLQSRLSAAPGLAHTAAWVDTGPVVTAGGLAAGIAMALHLVDRFVGRRLAERTARQLGYAWDPDAGVSRPS